MIIGVGFLLFAPINGAFKVFTIEELKDKPSVCKKRGMQSFPLETFEPIDICPKNTISRLIKEEIGLPLEQIRVLGFSFKEFHLIPDRKDISTFYGFGIFLGNPNQTFYIGDDDIKFVGWLELEELREQFVRVEVAPILTHFQKNNFLCSSSRNKKRIL